MKDYNLNHTCMFSLLHRFSLVAYHVDLGVAGSCAQNNLASGFSHLQVAVRICLKSSPYCWTLCLGSRPVSSCPDNSSQSPFYFASCHTVSAFQFSTSVFNPVYFPILDFFLYSNSPLSAEFFNPLYLLSCVLGRTPGGRWTPSGTPEYASFVLFGFTDWTTWGTGCKV